MSLRKSIAIALSAATLFAVAGCGTTDDSDTSSSTKSSTSSSKFDASTIKKDDKIAAMLPDSITKDGKLTVGAELTYAPAEFVGSDGKTPQGYDIDLTKALAAVFGLKADVVSSSFDSIIPSVGTKYDLGISGFTVDEDRLSAANWVTYGKAGMTYAVKKGNPEKIDVNNLCGVKIAAQTGTVEEESAKDTAAKCKKDGKDETEVQSFDQQTAAATAVVTGKADIFYADTPVTGYAVKQTDGALETLGEDAEVSPLGIAISKDDQKTTDAVKAAVEKLISDGTYKKIFDGWGAEGVTIDAPKVNDATV
ncbi:MAG: ABC transporter substrate-binding protein [Bifidobacteriaceae bacterium]|jgi:polar amino acid transport system substrate-binding protein|nr:ABC transporter substrate-binding protein [Bifidobacteriaceae bacterium]